MERNTTSILGTIFRKTNLSASWPCGGARGRRDLNPTNLLGYDLCPRNMIAFQRKYDQKKLPLMPFFFKLSFVLSWFALVCLQSLEEKKKVKKEKSE